MMIPRETSEFASPSERRQAARFRLSLPISWQGGSGRTRDMSRTGAYFVADSAPAEGGMVSFSLTLLDRRLGVTVPVSCLGQVVRVNPEGKEWGIAVRFEQFAFERGTSSPSEWRDACLECEEGSLSSLTSSESSPQA